MGRCKRSQPALGLLQLALEADPVSAPGLVPGDRDVDEALEEVLLSRVGGAPRVLERLVGLEVRPVAHQPEPAGQVVLHGRRTWTSSPSTRTS